MEDEYFEIYFRDLNEDAQNRLLKAAGVEDPSELHKDIDVFPIAMYLIPKKD